MRLEPPHYDGRAIRRLRPPEVEGVQGDWTSRWLVRLRSAPDDRVLTRVAAKLASAERGCDIRISQLEDDAIRLELRSHVHPLEVEAYPLIDRVLRGIDEALGGIAEINGSPRDWWRTFRQEPGRSER